MRFKPTRRIARGNARRLSDPLPRDESSRLSGNVDAEFESQLRKLRLQQEPMDAVFSPNFYQAHSGFRPTAMNTHGDFEPGRRTRHWSKDTAPSYISKFAYAQDRSTTAQSKINANIEPLLHDLQRPQEFLDPGFSPNFYQQLPVAFHHVPRSFGSTPDFSHHTRRLARSSSDTSLRPLRQDEYSKIKEEEEADVTSLLHGTMHQKDLLDPGFSPDFYQKLFASHPGSKLSRAARSTFRRQKSSGSKIKR